jgi:tryptophanyl-tRNA synthetase
MMKKRAFSGIQPSGDLHIGNYLGALKQWVRLQDDYDVIAGIVDEHAITVPQDPEDLRRRTLELAMIYIAAGLDPQKTTLMVQSWVSAHAELGWILGCFTPLGDLERMTQFKDKRVKQQSVLAGLFNYPVLMAADILLYHTEVVPVGEDQVQHIELARSIAKRFNSRYGETFTIPEVMLQKETARVMSLTDPTKKMSKSDADKNGYILLTDSPEIIRAKMKAAVTDSGKEIVYDLKEKPAITNLLVIFSEFSGEPIKALEKRYGYKGYAEFKSDAAEAVIAGLKPLQQKFAELNKDRDAVVAILKEDSQKATEIANETLRTVKEKVGFLI